jgi:hypothetical protein
MLSRLPSTIVIAALAAGPAPAQPGGMISAPSVLGGASSYGLTGSPTGQTDETNPTGFFLNTANSGANQLIYNWLFYRVAGDSVQRPFGNYTKSDGFPIVGTSHWPSGQAGGDNTTATYDWNEYTAAGLRFTADETLTISSGATANHATLTQSVTITNPNISPLTISIYEAAIPYPGGGTIQTLSASGGINAIDVLAGDYRVTFSADGATAYQASTDPSRLCTTTPPESGVIVQARPYLCSRSSSAQSPARTWRG